MLFAVATPMAMIAPMSEGTLNVVCVDEQHPHDAGQRARQRHDDDQRIEPRLEVDHQQEVDQQDREHQPERQGP